jgi:dihydroorotase
VANIEAGLADGALGIGMGINYTPAATQQEIYRVFQIAAAAKVPIYVHVRGAGPREPNGSLSSIQEMLADALATGAPLHIVHLGSSGLGQGPMLATMIDAARARGLDVTTEVYPYTAGSTFIQSAIFDPGWQDRMGIGYQDLQWPATNERLTQATFDRYRHEGGWVIIHMIPETTVDSLVAHPGVMIASDGVPIIDGRGHPRGVGTYARVLGRFVREKKALSLMDALRKTSYLPAERLRGAVPEMARKGRIKLDADADLVVFDPATVIDRATFDNPAQASVGIPYVLVNGTFVVRDGKLVDGVLPGRPIRRATAAAPR